MLANSSPKRLLKLQRPSRRNHVTTQPFRFTRADEVAILVADQGQPGTPAVHPNLRNRVIYLLSPLASMMLFCVISLSISSVVYGIPFDRTSYPSAVTRITSSTNTAKFSSLE